MRTLFLALILCALCFSTASAQSSISGYVYNLHDGKTLEGTRVSLKNQSGITVHSREAKYTNSEGYFVFRNLKEGDYRLEFTHVYETKIGETGLRVVTDEVITLVDTDIEYGISLSKAILELQVASWLENEKRMSMVTSRESAILGSRMIDEKSNSIRLQDFMEIIPTEELGN
ncbi:MAG: carboxypeptidase-like regulatory domain-containing protein [Rhodothermales bacterium]